MVVRVANFSWHGGIEKKNINIHILVILVTKLGAFPHRSCVHARSSSWTEPHVPISARERWVRSADASLFLVFYFFFPQIRDFWGWFCRIEPCLHTVAVTAGGGFEPLPGRL